MHPKLIQVAKVMARWPVVGPCIRYAAKVIRQGPPPPPAPISAPDTQENLLQSVPVTLRHLERELHAVRTQLSEVVMALQKLQAIQANQAAQTIQATSTNHAAPQTQALAALKAPSIATNPGVAQVLNADKLSSARTNGLRLTFGTDVVPREAVKPSNRSSRDSNNSSSAAKNMIVIHDRPSAGVDIISSTWDLPFECGLTKSIAVGEWLQRHSTEALHHTVLPKLFRLLEPGGELEICVLDASALLKNPKANLRSINGKAKESHRCAESVEPIGLIETGETLEPDESKEPKEPNEPQTLFTRESLEGLLTDAGFTNITVTAEPSTAMLQAVATKPQ